MDEKEEFDLEKDLLGLDDVEAELKEAAHNISPCEFTERWAQIERRLLKQAKMPEHSKAKRRRKLLQRILPVAACFVVALAVALPVIICNLPNNKHTVKFLIGELNIKVVTENEFYTGLSNADISPVGFEIYDTSGFDLFFASDESVVGGSLRVTQKEMPSMSATIGFYNATVVDDKKYYADFNLNYETDNAEIKYKLTDHLQEGNIEAFTYKAVAWTNDLYYRIDYFTVTDNVTDFFDELFA